MNALLRLYLDVEHMVPNFTSLAMAIEIKSTSYTIVEMQQWRNICDGTLKMILGCRAHGSKFHSVWLWLLTMKAYPIQL